MDRLEVQCLLPPRTLRTLRPLHQTHLPRSLQQQVRHQARRRVYEHLPWNNQRQLSIRNLRLARLYNLQAIRNRARPSKHRQLTQHRLHRLQPLPHRVFSHDQLQIHRQDQQLSPLRLRLHLHLHLRPHPRHRRLHNPVRRLPRRPLQRQDQASLLHPPLEHQQRSLLRMIQSLLCWPRELQGMRHLGI